MSSQACINCRRDRGVLVDAMEYLARKRRSAQSSKKQRRRGSSAAASAAAAGQEQQPAPRQQAEQTSNSAAARNSTRDQPCRFFAQGSCRDGDQCRFKHEIEREFEEVDLDDVRQVRIPKFKK
eukprot:tig00021357_g20797.t1